MNGDFHPATAKTNGDSPPDALTRASHQRYPPSEIHSAHSWPKACVLPLEPLQRNMHHSKRPRARYTVPVGPAARHQTQMIGKRGEPQYVFGVVARMSDLDTIESLLGERLDPLAGAAMAWMGNDSDTACLVDESNRVGGGESILGDECRSARAEISAKCVTCIDCPALGDECPGDMRPTDCRATGLVEHGLEGDAHAVNVEQFDDLHRAVAPHLAEIGKARLYQCRVGDMKAEDVGLEVILDGAQLHSGDDPDTEILTCCAGFSQAVDGIMVGQGKRRKSYPAGGANDFSGGQRSIRGSRVRMKVDETLATRSRPRRVCHAA
jgi:hypothetical protein